MQRRLVRTVMLGALAALLPAAAPAQVADRIRGGARGDVVRGSDRYEHHERYERYDRHGYHDHRGGRVAAGGPAFCRSGSGHPVFGRQWCVQKGLGLGDRHTWWERVRWDDVILRAPRDRRRDHTRGLDERDLLFVLGHAVFGRVHRHGRDLGYGVPLTGAWLREPDGLVLRVLAGDLPIAEFAGADRDGRVREVRLSRIR
jgi:hypothetical protein